LRGAGIVNRDDLRCRIKRRAIDALTRKAIQPQNARFSGTTAGEANPPMLAPATAIFLPYTQRPGNLVCEMHSIWTWVGIVLVVLETVWVILLGYGKLAKPTANTPHSMHLLNLIRFID